MREGALLSGHNGGRDFGNTVKSLFLSLLGTTKTERGRMEERSKVKREKAGKQKPNRTRVKGKRKREEQINKEIDG